MKRILFLILILPVIIQAQNTEVQDMPEMTAIASTDVLYIVDDPTGTPASEKITALNLFDMIKTFALLDTIVADKSLANLNDAMTWVALGTFNLGITITTGDPFILGAVRWDDGSDQIDGEQIADDTIDNDSIDWGDMTDLGTDGIVSADSVALTTDTTGNYSTGNAEGGDALVSVAVEITDNEATAENNPIVFVAGADDDGGDLGLETDGHLHYNPSTGTVTATEFVGGGAGLTAIDGENVSNDTIDNDSIDWGDMTDLTTDGALDADVVDEAHIADNGIDSEHYNDGSIDLIHIAAAAYAVDIVTTAPVTGATDNVLVGADADVTIALDFTAAWNFGGAAGSEWVNDAAPTTDAAGEIALDTTIADHQPLWQYYDGGENMTIIAIDTAQLPAVDNEIVKYDAGSDKFVLEADVGGGTMDSFFAEDGDTTEVEIDDAKEWKFVEGASIDIDWTDTSTGSDADPFDLTIKLVVADDESTDDDHEIVFTTDNATLESDGDFHYSPDTGTVTAIEFVGGGANLTAIDAATGDSATAFFDAGTIEHEWGGLQANVAAYTGLIAITGADTTAEIDSKTELEGQIADVADFAEADGDIYSNNHDFGSADLEIPQASPAVPNADGEIEVDFTDGKVVIQHGSAHAELGASTDVVMGSLIDSWGGTIYEPDGVNDVFTVKAINSIEFPHGVVITAIYLGVSENSNYTLTVQNFDDFDTINGGNPTIDTVAYVADATGEIIDETPTFATIAAGQLIMLSIPATDVDWIHFEIYFYEPAA